MSTLPLAVSFSVILAFCVAYVAFELIRIKREKKRAREFEGSLGLQKKEVDKELLRESLADLSEKWQTSVAQLRDTGVSIYDLPWYLLIGEPQSGKSTLLKNSGQEFPVGVDALSGTGGTRNCDWWFTNEAVILDTAGRFTFQEETAPDRQEWEMFLKLLRKHRRDAPINGAIVVIPATSLVEDTAEEQEKKAKNIRQKLLQLQNDLGIRFPIFILVTKADRILGFTEFFSKLEPAEQRQLFGWSNPGPPDEGWNLGSFGAVFDGMVERAHKQRMRFLKEEDNLPLVDKLFVYPEELAAIREPLANYLYTVFKVSRFEEPFMFRGFYLTSGVQQGRPVPLACRDLLRVQYGDPQGVLEDLEQVFSRSRAFFIRDFYEKKLFPEKGLIARTRAAEKRGRGYRMVMYGLGGSLAASTLLLLGIGWISLFSVLSPIKKVSTAASLCLELEQPITCSPEMAYRLIKELEQEKEKIREARWTLRVFLRSATENEVTQELVPETQALLFRRNILEPVLASFEERSLGLDWRLHENDFDIFYAGFKQLLLFKNLQPSMMDDDPRAFRHDLRISPLLAFCKVIPGRDPQGRGLDEWLKTGVDLAQIDMFFMDELVARESAFRRLAVPEPIQSYNAFQSYWATYKTEKGDAPSYAALSAAVLESPEVAPDAGRMTGDRKMANLFEVASRVSTPLALSGLVAAFLFLILRQIIAKDIFPQLTKAMGGDLLRQMINNFFVLALVAVLLGFLGFLYANTDRDSAKADRAATPLDEAPAPLMPEDGAVLTQFPRRTELSWAGLSWARTYLVEVEIQDPSDLSWRSYPGLEGRRVQGTSISFEFVGGRSGRWRVAPVLADGKAGNRSAWSHFTYRNEQSAGVVMEPGAPSRENDKGGSRVEPTAGQEGARRVLSRERTAAEVLAVLDETPVLDRERTFEDHFKGKWPPGPGWSGTVEGYPRVNGTGGCDLLVVERETKARIMAYGPAKACDVRNRDRVTVAGPIIDFDTALLTIRCVEVSIQ